MNDTSSSLTMVVAETDKDGKETASYTRGEELLSMERDGEVWYYLYDGHGSVRTLTNEAGRVTDRYSYDAYGNLLEKEGDTKNEFLYTGEQYNANTGLYYLRARYMNPSTGTFISMDSYQGSIYDPVTLHKYLYANANPVMYTDPSGYSSMGEQVATASIWTGISDAWAKAGAVAMRIFAKIRAAAHTEIIGLTVSAKITETICNVIINKNIFSEKDLLFYVQCEVLVGVNSSIRVETKEEAQAYALELVKDKKKQQYMYYPAYAGYPGASVSLQKGLTLEEAKQRIILWGDVWAVDEAAAIDLCNALGGVSNEGATRDGNPNNALHYHAVLSLGHRHIYFGIDKNLMFIP